MESCWRVGVERGGNKRKGRREWEYIGVVGLLRQLLEGGSLEGGVQQETA